MKSILITLLLLVNAAWAEAAGPETRKVQEGILEEMYEAFGRPGYVHLGCDEADGPSCSACCSASYRQLVADHIRALCEKVVRMGARPMAWHDMLLARGDARWRGFYQNGAASAWSAKAVQEQIRGGLNNSTPPQYSYHWRQTGNDTPGGDAYAEQGWYTDQIRTECHRN